MLMDKLNKPLFSQRTLLDRQQAMWDLWQSGMEMSAAAAVLGWDRHTVYNRIREAGGVRPRRMQTRARLSFEDRVHIEIGLKQHRSMRAIAADLGRAPSTISREVANHRDARGGYVAKRAHAIAFEDARRRRSTPTQCCANECCATWASGTPRRRSRDDCAMTSPTIQG